MILLACYVLSFGNFQDLGPLRETERIEAPVTLTFDLVSALKAVTRIIAFSLVAAGLLRKRKSPKWQLVKWHFFPLALFGLWGIASTLWSPMPLYSFGQALEFILLVMVAVLAALVCNYPTRLGQVLFHLCTIHLLYVLTLIGLSVTIPSSARILRSATEHETVLYATTADASYIMNPAQIAAIACTGLILVFASKFLWNWRWARLLFFPALIVEGWVLFVTQTRAMIVTTLLLTGACLLFWGRGKLVATAALTCALIGISYITLDPNLHRLETVGESVETFMTRGQSKQQLGDLSGRVSNWSQVLSALPESPIVGHGYSMATPSGKMWREGVLRHYSAHNILLRVFAGTGLIGGTLFIWGFCRLFFGTCKRLRGFKDKRLPFLSLLIILLIFMTGIFGDSVVGPLDVTSMAMFVLLGIGIGTTPRPTDLPSTPLSTTLKSTSIKGGDGSYEQGSATSWDTSVPRWPGY